jgi:(4S)-4-hydroxy-5-phosphonooxypentane-2,3-dione isomerase
MAHKARCLKDEPGTLQFEVLIPNDDTTKILLYELYRDAAAFEVHWNGPSTARVRQEAGSMVVKIYGTKCVLSSQSEQQALKGRAGANLSCSR